MQQQPRDIGHQIVTTLTLRKYLYRKPGHVYFRDPRTYKLSPPPLGETSDEFAMQYDALPAALKATSEMDLFFWGQRLT